MHIHCAAAVVALAISTCCQTRPGSHSYLCPSPCRKPQRASSGQGAGPSRQPQQHAAAQRRGGGSGRAARGGEAEVIDLTGDEPLPPPQPRDGDLQIVSSTVQRAARAPTRGVKRPRGALAAPLSPIKQRLLQNLLAPPPPPPPEPEPEGPKCGICMEVRRPEGGGGTSSSRAPASHRRGRWSAPLCSS